MLGVVVLIQPIFADQKNNFHQKFFIPIEDIDLLSSNLKRYFTFNHFL